MRIVLSLLFIGTLTACSGWNSELNTAEIVPEKVNLKPRCQFKLKENCWTRSMKLVMACVPPTGTTPEIMSPDKRFCSSTDGKYIDFVNPLSLEGDFSEEPIEFYVNDGPEKTCFHFEGTSSEFVINDYTHGQLRVEMNANGDTHITCFFGEKLVIPSEVKEQGCRNQKANPKNFLPTSGFVKSESPQFLEIREGFNYQFFFSGLGQKKQEIFNCQH